MDVLEFHQIKYQVVFQLSPHIFYFVFVHFRLSSFLVIQFSLAFGFVRCKQFDLDDLLQLDQQFMIVFLILEHLIDRYFISSHHIQ